ncbi:peptidyl-prolyl cis-trans isomerase FKBP62 [Cyclospora cayetanensis]|uniref:peptidylprolyl isomerase n=1 Tax=Cyclospora cayetanensis TaxID=88456 RepID=A0A6P6S382_9EIME|nr:peptidyl-prolyl cis-trans isomerase FKBP62 [Cyclospora cayetanensis]
MVAHKHGGCCGGHSHTHEVPLPAAPVDNSPPHAVNSELDVSKDGGVIKKVLIQGTGDRPPRGNEVEVHYVGTLEDGTQFDSSRDRDQPFRFVLGEGQVIKGWDLGVATMSVGEKSLLTIQSNYGYGEAGAGGSIPPNATLKFEVELLSFRPKPKARWAMSVEEKIQAALDEKEKGNEAFKRKNLAEATAAYREGLCFLEHSDQWSEEQQIQKCSVEVSLRLNLSNCFFKTGEFAQAIDEATAALKLDEKNSKAWYRRGVARAAFGLLDEARTDLASAARIDPKNVEIRNELKKCKEKLEEVRKKEKTTFGAIFTKVALYDEKAGVRNLDRCPRVFMDIRVGDKPVKRVAIALYQDTVPRTAENFRALCVGEAEKGADGSALTFKNSAFHLIIKGLMMQGGDINGKGGESIYGEKFNDEAFVDKHLHRGQLSMANTGPNTNSSQFFIIFGSAPHLDGKHVVFGEIVEGLELLDQVEEVPTDGADKPEVPVVIEDCGAL